MTYRLVRLLELHFISNSAVAHQTITRQEAKHTHKYHHHIHYCLMQSRRFYFRSQASRVILNINWRWLICNILNLLCWHYTCIQRWTNVHRISYDDRFVNPAQLDPCMLWMLKKRRRFVCVSERQLCANGSSTHPSVCICNQPIYTFHVTNTQPEIPCDRKLRLTVPDALS